MSLNTWSLIFFAAQFILYITIYWSVFRQASLPSHLITIIAWAVSLIVTLVYGIATQQAGFVLMFVAIVGFVILEYSNVRNNAG